MKIIRNQKGGVLPYVLMIMMVIMIFTPVLLSYGSNQQLSLIDRENEKKAYMLATTGMEAFINYLNSPLPPGTDKESRFYSYSGLNDKGYRFNTPEGDPVFYILKETNRVNYLSTVTSTAEVGTGSQKKSKSVSYSFDLSPCGGPYITSDPAKRINAPENTIYVQGTTQGISDNISVQHVPELQSLIRERMNQISEEISTEINRYVNQAEPCGNCSMNEIQAKINGSSSNPVIIRVNNLNLSNNATVTLGSTTKAVILIVDNLTASNNVEINIYGTLIVLNMISANNNFELKTYTVNGNYGDLWVTSPFSTENNVYLNIAATLYAYSLTLDNNADIRAKNLVVNGMLDMKNNAELTVHQDIFTSSLKTFNNTKISATGDLFVEKNLEANNNLEMNSGGAVAVGGNITFNNNIAIHTGGGTTSLILNPEDGDYGRCQENPNWNIGRVEDKD